MSKNAKRQSNDRQTVKFVDLLKNKGQKKKNKKEKSASGSKNLPSAEVNASELTEAELSGENFVTEEEAFGEVVENESYLTLARRYRLVRWGVIGLLILFLLLMFSIFREEITVENFRYLMRNVNFELKTEIDEAGIISYDSDSSNTFLLFKNSLAVANTQKLTIFDAGGRSSCTVNQSYAAPALKASSKYLLSYDRSGGSFGIFNSFDQLYSDTTGYPISDADITDSGVFAIASRSKEYFGVVSIYNSAFKLLNKVQKNKYIAAIDLSDDGSTILIASYYCGESGYTTEIMSLKVDSDEPDLLFTVEDTFPYRVQWTENGSFLLLSDSGIKFYDESGKVYNEYIFLGHNVIKYSMDAGGAAIVSASPSDASRSTLVLLNAKGEETGSFDLNGAVESVVLSGESVCLLGGSQAWKVENGNLFSWQANCQLQAAAFRTDLCWICAYTRALLPDWKPVEA